MQYGFSQTIKFIWSQQIFTCNNHGYYKQFMILVGNFFKSMSFFEVLKQWITCNSLLYIIEQYFIEILWKRLIFIKSYLAFVDPSLEANLGNHIAKVLKQSK